MMKHCGFFLAAVAVAALLVPDTSFAASSRKQKVQRARIVVHAKPRRWHGYGFLPGYRPSIAGTGISTRSGFSPAESFCCIALITM